MSYLIAINAKDLERKDKYLNAYNLELNLPRARTAHRPVPVTGTGNHCDFVCQEFQQSCGKLAIAIYRVHTRTRAAPRR